MAIDSVKVHTAWLMERGGARRIAEIVNITQLTWGRVRDDISQADVQIALEGGDEQFTVLSTLVGATGRYELAVWRGSQRVWEGPITLTTFNAHSIEIQARDVMHYAERTWMVNAYDNSYPAIGYVTTRAALILTTELDRRNALEMSAGLPDMNVTPYIVDHHETTDAQTSASTLPYQYTVFDHVDALAANSGMDYTVVGRAIHLWDTSEPALGYTQTATENDFLGDMYVSVYGMDLATRTAVTDGQGNFGLAGDVDPYYGSVEALANPYDENATTAPTTEELESQAERNLTQRNPTPLQVRVPDGSSINIDGIFTIESLVPGVYVPLVATINGVRISQMQKLFSVQVQETSDGETIQVTLAPASKDDDEGS
jgi:hypothetical protein